MKALKSLMLGLLLMLPFALSAQQGGEPATDPIQVTMISKSKFGLPHNYMVKFPGLDAQMGFRLKDLEANPEIISVKAVPDHDYLIVMSHYTEAELLLRKIDNFVEVEHKKLAQGY